MRLILLRHGPAVEGRENLDDFDRDLSPKGRSLLEENLPILSHFLASLKNCTVWASPTNRTVETAEILTRYMPRTDYEVKNFIASGDRKSLDKALRSFNHHDTLVIVGHEPHLSDWVQYLTGREGTFQKGHFKMLYLAPDKPRDAVLLTRPELNQIHYLEPLDLPLGAGMRLILRRQHDQVITSRDHFLDDPDDAGKLHGLRINLRIGWAMMEYLRPWAKTKALEKAQKIYRDLYDETTHLREIDVLLKSIHDSRNWRLHPLTAALMSERNSEALALTDHLSDRKSQKRYYKAYERIISMVETVEAKETITQTVHPKMAAMLAEIAAALKDLDYDNLEAIEDVRRQCKTYRYLYERFAALASTGIAYNYLSVRRLHRLLGDITDATYNVRALRALFDEEDVKADYGLSQALRAYEEMAEDQEAKAEEKIREIEVSPLKNK